MQQWLNRNWVAAALCMAILLVLLMPIHAQRRPPAWLFIFAMLPVYMFHQVEEHTDDRFRVFVNQHVFHAIEAVPPHDSTKVLVFAILSASLGESVQALKCPRKSHP